MRPSIVSASLLGLALVGCASSGAGNAGTASASQAAASGATSRWIGTFSPTLQRTASISGSDRARAYGEVVLVRHSSDPDRMTARIQLTAPVTNSLTGLQWALLPGRCGSANLPLLSVDRFPPIEMGGNNRGALNADVPLRLPQGGSYHVNVFWPGGTQLENVMTCANLRAEG